MIARSIARRALASLSMGRALINNKCRLSLRESGVIPVSPFAPRKQRSPSVAFRSAKAFAASNYERWSVPRSLEFPSPMTTVRAGNGSSVSTAGLARRWKFGSNRITAIATTRWASGFGAAGCWCFPARYQVGYIRNEIATEIRQDVVRGSPISVRILDATGGGWFRKQYYGVNIEIRVGVGDEFDNDRPQPNRRPAKPIAPSAS